MDETTSLWNKPQTDVTVGDSVKINLAYLGAVALFTVATVAVCEGADKFKTWKANRQNKTPDPE